MQKPLKPNTLEIQEVNFSSLNATGQSQNDEKSPSSEPRSTDLSQRLDLPPLAAKDFLQQLAGAMPVNPSACTGDATVRGSIHFQEVWTCGQNSYGELAHGDTTTRKEHTCVDILQGKDIIDVAAGNEHTVVLTRNGEVLTSGYNDNGQCGQGTTQRVGQLTPVEKLSGRVATQVHAYNGCEHTLVVLDSGRLVSFGYNYRGQLGHGTTSSEPVPRPVLGLDGRKVVAVSCSYYHTVVACEDGQAFSFGRNDFGQLGHGDIVDKKLPTLIQSLSTEGLKINLLACGQYHTVVGATTGELLACGKNDYGQLGLDVTDNQRAMRRVRGLAELNPIVDLRCGYYHTLALTSNGRVLSFGRNDYGQLGLGHITQRVYMPTPIDSMEGKGVVCMAAGCYHSMLGTSNGMLYAFGRNNHGQLGTGDTNERHSPCPIDRFLGKRVIKVAAGFYHTIVLVGGPDDSNGGSGEIADNSSEHFSP